MNALMNKFLLLLIIIFPLNSELFSQRILLNQSFENGPYTADSIPLRWAKFKVNGPGVCNTSPPIADWRIRDSGSVFCSTPPLPGSTSKAYYSRKSLSIPFTATTGSITDDWVFTDSLMLMYGDSLKFRIQLGTWPDGQSTYYLDSLQVWVVTVQAPTGGTRTKIGTITSLQGPNNIWQFKTYNLSQFAWQKVYVGFRYYMNISVNGIMVNIDNIFVGNLGGAVGISSTNTPEDYNLKQNYPNPFNPATQIEFTLPKKEFVRLAVFNPIGQEIALLINDEINAGTHFVSFDASDMPGGIYFYKITAGDFTMTRKMSFVK
jgi:hypothetical protein